MSSAYKNHEEDDDIRHKGERRHRVDRRRSRSGSLLRRHRDENRSRSRSHSVERYRRRHTRRSRSRSRSHSRSYGYSSHRKSSKRYEDSRSRSRSRSSHRSHKRSRSPRRSHKRNESRKSNSRSSERYLTKEINNDKAPRTKSHSESPKSIDEDNSSSQNFSCAADPETLENLPLPESTEANSNSYEYLDDSQDPIDKERIHREIEEKLRQTLAKEGKIYPPPKPEASHPVFANDGSFLEIFKKMQEAQQQQQTMTTVSTALPSYGVSTPSTSAAAYTVPIVPTRTAPPPIVGRRRGGKILKTGVVAKPKAVNNGGDDKDFWSLYLAEVNKYKNNACELNSGNRPLLK